MRKTFFFGIAVAGLLSGSQAHAQQQRAPSVGQRITEQSQMRARMQAIARQEYQMQQRKQAALRTNGSQNYYKGPQGQIVNERDLPPKAFSTGYKWAGNKPGVYTQNGRSFLPSK